MSHRAYAFPQVVDSEADCSHQWGNNDGKFPAIRKTDEICIILALAYVTLAK